MQTSKHEPQASHPLGLVFFYRGRLDRATVPLNAWQASCLKVPDCVVVGGREAACVCVCLFVV